MTVRGAAFLGIGAMVGAGIFALLGEAGTVAGSAVWLSFLLAGIVAALLGYTTVKLGVRYPSSGGLIAYLAQGFGNGRLVGIASWLGYFAAIVIVGSMVAVAFGSYATSLFIGDDAGAAWDNVFTSIIVVAMAAINMIGARFVDRAQSLIVVALLAVFAVFIAVTIVDIDTDLLAFSGYPPFSDIVASVALTFFAYLGFSVITFTVGDLRDPARSFPKAMYLALGITTVTYVLISLGVFGTLTVDEVIGYGETAIAEAARPALGDAGFVIMAIAALLATSSSVNAVLYASSGLTAMLAEAGQFPPFFGRGSRLGENGGMLITAGIVLVISNLVDLSAIASVGSACSLLIFLLVGASGYRLRRETGSLGAIVLTAMATTTIVLIFFAIDTLRNAPETFVAIVCVTALAVVLDLVWKRIRGPRQDPVPTVPRRPEAESKCAAGLHTRDRRSRSRAPAQARPLADRPEPARARRRDDDERRRLRRGLVRRGRDAEALSHHASRVERSQPAAARGRDPFSAVLRAHPGLDRNGDSRDEHAPLPARAVALDAQRAHPRVSAPASRVGARSRRLAVRLDRRHDRLGNDVLPRAHVRP